MNAVNPEQARKRSLRNAARADAAESRIAAALACHRPTPSLRTADGAWCCKCGFLWDAEADRCTSPTVTALLADPG